MNGKGSGWGIGDKGRAVMMALGVTAKPHGAISATWAKSYWQGGLTAPGFRKRGSYLLLMLWVRSVRSRNVGAADY
jgi:hypothetical protein